MADYQKMYVILCAAASDAADELADIPLAMRCRDKLQKDRKSTRLNSSHP